MKEIIEKLTNYKVIILLYILLAIAASVQSLLLKERPILEGKPKYTNYNNYIIFKESFQHLKDNKDLYQAYPKEQWDLFKYSPSFAAIFSVLAYTPDWLGLTLWNVINALVLLLSIYYLPNINLKAKGFILLTCSLEFMGSVQNSQSNALIAGLIILSFGFLEKGNGFMAAFCIVFSVFIKIFGIIGLVLFLFYPKKWKSGVFIILWTIILIILPLIFVDIEYLKSAYYSWGHLLAMDHSISSGLSVMGLLNSWFSQHFSKNIILLFGITLFCIPLLRINEYKNQLFRILMLSSVLLWIVIFNHKAESPTFIIAMAGIAIWYFTSEKTYLNTALIIFAFVLTSLSATDLVPKLVWNEIIKPYNLKALPSIIIWIKVSYDLMKVKQIDFDSQQS